MKTSSDKVKRAIEVIDNRLRALRTALFQAIEDGAQSVSISSGGASQAYTRMSTTDVRQAIADLELAKQSLMNHGKRKSIAPNFTFGH